MQAPYQQTIPLMKNGPRKSTITVTVSRTKTTAVPTTYTKHVDLTVTKRATETVTTIISTKVTALQTNINTATVLSSITRIIPFTTEEAPATVTIGGGEVHCNIAGLPRQQYLFNGKQLKGDLDGSIFSDCKSYCSALTGAVSFGFNSMICLCFTAGAQTVVDTAFGDVFRSYDMACDAAEQSSRLDARSQVVTAGPHLIKRDDRIEIPDWFPGPRDFDIISSECLCLFNQPRTVSFKHVHYTATRLVRQTQTKMRTDISYTHVQVFPTSTKIVFSTKTAESTKTTFKTVTKSLTTTYWTLRTLKTTVTEAKDYIVTRTSILTIVNTSTIPIATEVDTVTVTGVYVDPVTDTVGSTVTVTHATIQDVLSTITITVPTITVTAEVTTIWG
ncbi:hypothetical protein FCOIX_4645 [Fusarium coicis]|nr:hypothetical protein FCOIX_4645 [Fusarium coicis]